MKNLLNLFLLVFLFSAFQSCSNENLNEYIAVENVIEKMQDYKKSSKENAVFATITYDPKSGQITKYQIVEKEFDLLVSAFGEADLLESRADRYKVSCSKAVYTDSKGNKTADTTCEGAINCGRTAKKCLDAGGCVEVCNATLIWVEDAYEVGEDVLFVTDEM
jgi:ferredoxin